MYELLKPVCKATLDTRQDARLENGQNLLNYVFILLNIINIFKQCEQEPIKYYRKFTKL